MPSRVPLRRNARSGPEAGCNRGGAYTIFDTGKAAWAPGRVTHSTGRFRQGAFAVSSGPANWATQFVAESQWRSQIDTLHAVKNSKVCYFQSYELRHRRRETRDWTTDQPVPTAVLLVRVGIVPARQKTTRRTTPTSLSLETARARQDLVPDEYDFIDLGKGGRTLRCHNDW